MAERRVYDDPRWRILRRATLTRDGWRCQLKLPVCVGLATEADHIRGLAEGGEPFDLSNLQAACKPCNSAKGGLLAGKIKARPEPWPKWLA